MCSADFQIRFGRKGFVRPHASRELEMVFKPNYSGSYSESFTLVNRLDEDCTIALNLKAKVLC